MQCAVIPIQNEENSVGRVLETVLSLPVDLIIPVINGSRDRSLEIVRSYKDKRIIPIQFTHPLGLDVPRAVGAAHAKTAGASAVLFVDGDMGGKIAPALADLLSAVSGGLDLALTDCYPARTPGPSSPLAQMIFEIRCLLNCALGIYPAISGASPCHGPHAVSRDFLAAVPLENLSVPPVALLLAVHAGLTVGIGASLPHAFLGSAERDDAHVVKLAATIIGDHLEAFSILEGEKERSRSLDGITFNGYDSDRRRDLLKNICNQ